MSTARLVVCVCILLGFVLRAAGQEPTFKSTTQLIIETVSVKDGRGKSVEGLTANDFTLTEDGVAQRIALVEYQKLEEGGNEGDIQTIVQPSRISSARLTEVMPERPGDIRYRNRRLLALYFDMSAMPLTDQWRARSAALTFVQTRMSPADLVAILRYSEGRMEVLNDFTADRDQLESSLKKLLAGEDADQQADDSDQLSAVQGAAFGQNNVEFEIFNLDRQLGALQTAVTMLGHLNEKKSLIYFASGLRLNGFDNQAQLNATINAATRAGVSLYPIDARGLTAQAPLGAANYRTAGSVDMYSGAGALAQTTALQRSQDTLWTLAADTGGKALLDYNDLAEGIVQAEQAITSYYIIGYYTDKTDPDGRFRRIVISLKSPLKASLEYRKGYYAPKEFRKFNVADKERQLEDALMLPDPITDLTMAMEINYFQVSPAEYFVPIIVRIPGRELAVAQGRQTRLDIIAEIRESDVTISNLRDKVDVRLSGAAASEWMKRPVEYDVGFTLLPGKYRIKFLAREGETGRIGTYETQFVIPNLSREEKQIPISSVVLSSQRIRLGDAVYNAGKEKGQAMQAANPLVEGGQKLIPSVTRVFSRAKEMYVYLQAYQEHENTVHPLLAYVTFYRGSVKVFETTPLQANDAMKNPVKAIPIRFSIPSGKLRAGEYNCLVTVLDPSGGKAAFWQTPIMVVP